MHLGMKSIAAITLMSLLGSAWIVTAADEAAAPKPAAPKVAVADSGDAETVKALKQRETEFVEALAAAKVDVLQSMLADEYAATDPLGHVAGKQALVAFLSRGTFKVESAQAADMTASAKGDAGVVRARLTLKGQWEQKDISGEYRLTNTWVRQDGKWLLLAGHISRLNNKPAAGGEGR